MINYQFFPRSHGVTPHIRDIINCFKKVDEEKNENKHLISNEMLALVRPHLENLHFTVESGKAASNKINVPVLFGENDEIEKFYAADALSEDHKIVIEVEAGRAVINNQYLKDIFEACMMYEVEYLVLAVLNDYSYKSKGKQLTGHDYQHVKKSLETLYVSNRLQLPLKGILLIGY